jgi:hypothetical protein
MGVGVSGGQEKTEWCGRTGESEELRKIKNSGNEAKKYLKTKDITFLKGANFVRFARKLTLISRQKDQKKLHFAQTNRKRTGQGEAGAVTNSRLGMIWVASAPACQAVQKSSPRCLSDGL